MRIRLASILLVALALAVAGCGGGDDDTSAPASETTAQSGSGSGSSTSSGSSTTGGGSSGSFASAENCAELANMSSAFSQAMTASGGDLDAQAKFFQEFADKTPPEIRSDFQVLAKAFTAYLAAYSKLDLKPGATPTPQQIAELSKIASAFSAADVQKASEHITQWAQQNCKTS